MAAAIALLGFFLVCLEINSTKTQNWQTHYLPIQSDSQIPSESTTSDQNHYINSTSQNNPASILTTQNSRIQSQRQTQIATTTPIDYYIQNRAIQKQNEYYISHSSRLHPQNMVINQTNSYNGLNQQESSQNFTRQYINDDNQFDLGNRTIIQGKSNKTYDENQNINLSDIYYQSIIDRFKVVTSNNTSSGHNDFVPAIANDPAIGGEKLDTSNWGLRPESDAPEILGGEKVAPADFMSLKPGIHAIVGGEKITSEVLPLQWHVGVYSKAFRPYMQICGGTLVTTKAVLSAAHCFWNDLDGPLSASRFAVAAGKLYRPWHDPHDLYAQKSDVLAVHLPPRFRGATTSFQDDIAVVTLATPLTRSRAIHPVCVLFDEDLESTHLREGNEGIVLGWGLTAENGLPAQSLEYLNMPYVPIEKCVADAQPYFLKYITSDKICAGVTTGKALCRGDSGGGLVFFDYSSSERVPFLFGVASTAPRNEHLCNAHARASLTRVLAHRTFLRAHVPDIEDSCGSNYQTFASSSLSSRNANLIDVETPHKLQPTFICNCYCNNSRTP